MIWIDISNAPHAMFFRRLIKERDDVFVTARDFGPIKDILRREGIEFILVGKHGGKDLANKTIESGKRVAELAKIVSKEKPGLCLYKYSVEAARVAYGLKIPAIAVMDNELAEAQNMLTLPSAKKVICPGAVPLEAVKRYNQNVVQFDGVCEAANVSGFEFQKDVLKEVGVKEGKYSLLRDMPYQAAYCEGNEMMPLLIDELKQHGRVVVLPRSREDWKYAAPKVIVLKKSVESLSLMKAAKAVVSGGGSMNREAALLGTPSFSFFPKRLAVDDYLIGKGLMKRIAKTELMAQGLKIEEKRQVAQFENPLDLIRGEING